MVRREPHVVVQVPAPPHGQHVLAHPVQQLHQPGAGFFPDVGVHREVRHVRNRDHAVLPGNQILLHKRLKVQKLGGVDVVRQRDVQPEHVPMRLDLDDEVTVRLRHVPAAEPGPVANQVLESVQIVVPVVVPRNEEAQRARVVGKIACAELLGGHLDGGRFVDRAARDVLAASVGLAVLVAEEVVVVGEDGAPPVPRGLRVYGNVLLDYVLLTGIFGILGVDDGACLLAEGEYGRRRRSRCSRRSGRVRDDARECYLLLLQQILHLDGGEPSFPEEGRPFGRRRLACAPSDNRCVRGRRHHLPYFAAGCWCCASKIHGAIRVRFHLPTCIRAGGRLVQFFYLTSGKMNPTRRSRLLVVVLQRSRAPWRQRGRAKVVVNISRAVGRGRGSGRSRVL
mmetsp:Transcript_16463/g.40737  ORF Transcript_16463/g.40737 Transcript_16463/m.40737 type:complete len:395 (+) Transcript_16463:1832-3016(+)